MMHEIKDPEESFTSDTNDNLRINVVEYYMVGNGGSYDKHYFVISVSVESQNYNVDRSYIDFVEFDRRIRKKFPKSSIPVLPLDATAAIQKAFARDPSLVNDQRRSSLGSGNAGGASNRNSMILNRDSLISAHTERIGQGNPYRIRDYLSEDISTKVSLLDQYLISIFSQHELVTCDELLQLLDEEQTSMLKQEQLEPLTVHDLLLLNVPINKVIVHRNEEFFFRIPAGHLILWRFSTKDYDIAFSVEMNGEIKIPYTRYKSNEQPMCGTLEAIVPSICVLKWDNSYAKFRTKQLSWSVKVVSIEEFNKGKQQALECSKEKRRFEQQKNALKRCTVKLAARLSGVILGTDIAMIFNDEYNDNEFHSNNNDSSNNNYLNIGSSHNNGGVGSGGDNNSKKRIGELEQIILQLKQENESLSNDLINIQSAYEEMQMLKEQAEESANAIKGSWSFSITQLESVQDELRQSKATIRELNEKLRLVGSSNNSSNHTLIQLQNKINNMDKIEKDVLSTCKQAILKIDKEHEFLTGKNTERMFSIQQIQQLHDRQQQQQQGVDDEEDAEVAHELIAAEDARDEQIEVLSNMVNALMNDINDCKAIIDDKNKIIMAISEKLNTNNK